MQRAVSVLQPIAWPIAFAGTWGIVETIAMVGAPVSVEYIANALSPTLLDIPIPLLCLVAGYFYLSRTLSALWRCATVGITITTAYIHTSLVAMAAMNLIGAAFFLRTAFLGQVFVWLILLPIGVLLAFFGGALAIYRRRAL